MVTALSRLSFIVRKIRKSPKLRRIMNKKCAETGVPCLIPIIDVRTRSNSTFDMLQRAISIKETISDTIYAHKNNFLIGLLLDAEDWNLMDQLTKILKPLKEVTLRSSLGRYALSICNVLPLFNFCIDMLIEAKAYFSISDDI